MAKTGYPVMFDVTHSVQLPGGQGSASGGQPEFIEPLARAGCAAGVDAIFLEVHDHPARALSDGSNALPLDRLAGAAGEAEAALQAGALLERGMSLETARRVLRIEAEAIAGLAGAPRRARSSAPWRCCWHARDASWSPAWASRG